MPLCRVISLFFPKRCLLCGEIIDGESELCPRCKEELTEIKAPVCPRCGLPQLCCGCSLLRAAFERRVSPLVYSGSARRGIARFKFQNKPYLAAFYSALMADTVRREYVDISFDCICCVPSHFSDYMKRGYNPPTLLAGETAKLLGLKADTALLVKLHRNKKQHELSSEQRAVNVQNVFSVSNRKDVRGKVILLCDDVATSGHTLSACATALLKAGALRVYCVTAAAVCKKRRKTR